MALIVNSFIFIVFRLIIGFCIGIILPLSITLIIENMPIKFRSFILSVLWCGYSISRLILLSIMLGIMPNMEEDQTANVFYLGAIIPFLSCIFSIFFITDSPRNLILIDKKSEAYSLISNIIGRDLSNEEKINLENDVSSGVNKELDGSFKNMFSPTLLRSTICIMLIWVLHSFVFYGTFITSTLTIKDLGQKEDKNNNEIIKDHITIALIFLPINFAGFFTEIKYFGRKKIYLLAYTLAFIFMLTCSLFSNDFATLYGVSTSLMGFGNNISNSYSSEIYPTKIRSTAISFLYFISRIASGLSQFIFLWLYNYGILFPYYFSVGLLVLTVICIFLLPYETYNVPLDRLSNSNNKDIEN